MKLRSIFTTLSAIILAVSLSAAPKQNRDQSDKMQNLHQNRKLGLSFAAEDFAVIVAENDGYGAC